MPTWFFQKFKHLIKKYLQTITKAHRITITDKLVLIMNNVLTHLLHLFIDMAQLYNAANGICIQRKLYSAFRIGISSRLATCSAMLCVDGGHGSSIHPSQPHHHPGKPPRLHHHCVASVFLHQDVQQITHTCDKIQHFLTKYTLCYMILPN